MVKTFRGGVHRIHDTPVKIFRIAFALLMFVITLLIHLCSILLLLNQE